MVCLFPKDAFPAQSVEILLLSSVTYSATSIIYYVPLCSSLLWTTCHFRLSDAVWIKVALSPPYLPVRRSFYTELKVTLSRLQKKNSLWESIQWKDSEASVQK